MRKIKVGIGGNGTVRIKVKKKKKNISSATTVMERPSTSAREFEGISIPSSLINQMEIRVESIFRPKVQDVEVVYALSGQDSMVDQLHKFSSNEVVAHATPEMISYIAEKMVEHIREERTDIPGLIIHAHSHPSGFPALSDIDKNSMPEVARRIRDIIPDAAVLFCVHAVSSEYRRPRKLPERISENRIRWSSITRLHEVAFFDEHAKPVVVGISG
jgi:proteasome lid subunit RPN8/RPN11